MIKCDGYQVKLERYYLTDFEKGQRFAKFGSYPEYEDRIIGSCLNKEGCPKCSCDGDKCKCDFYYEMKEAAKKENKENLDQIELEFYREWVLKHDLLFELSNEYEDWKKKRETKGK